MSKDTAYNSISQLVERFNEQLPSYKKADYNETLTRRDFIDPLFKALGWDVDNSNGYAEAYREVIHEDKIKIGGATKAPDYSFRLSGGKRLFFVEAKKPSVAVKDDIIPAYQIRRYGWSAKLPISIITDFEEFSVYDCTKKPNPTDKASAARIKYLTFDKYQSEFDFLWDTFSKEKVLKGSFDKYIASDTNKKGTATVDKEFLQSLDNWRTLIAVDICKKNKELDEDEINFAVQQTIDRLIFLRIAEDRSVEPYGQLKHSIANGNYYENLYKLFQSADDKYNSGLFDLKKDQISKGLIVDNKIIKTIINDLYYPQSPYEFSVLSVEILGSAYEQFLGKQIKIDASHKATVELKPEVRKAGGVYYTPEYIVDYIVHNTVGKLVENKTPKEVAKIKIVDPACGSGSFLIGAYQYLLTWYKDYYNINVKSLPKKNSLLTPDGNLTTAEKKKILIDNIYGVDIDINAVEVTKLSLLLKCLEGETSASISHQLSFFNERILPTLENNIKSGNSLIDTDFYSSELDFGDERLIKPFNWQREFSEIFRSGGFDIVIGNPPYIPIEFFKDSEKNYFNKHYSELTRKFETSVIFILKGLKLLNKNGLLGFISTQTWQTGENYTNFREAIFKNAGLLEIINLPFNIFKDAYVDTGIFIFSKKPTNEYRFFGYNKKTIIKNIEKPLFETIRTEDLSKENYKIILNKNVGELSRKFLSKQYKELGLISISTQGLSASRFTKTHTKKSEIILPFFEAKVKRYLFEPTNEYLVDLSNQQSLIKFYQQQSKILIRRIINRQNRLDATYFEQAGVFKKDLNPFIITDSSINTKYILGLINSRLFSWLYLNSSSIATKDDFRQTTLAELRKLPIRVIDDKQTRIYEHQIIKAVDQLLRLYDEKSKNKLQSTSENINREIEHWESEIDSAVFDLYEITETDKNIIEGTINEVIE